jgi:MFS family permease
MRNLLRLRNARIYLLGDLVSTLGDNALWLAMAIWMKETTGSSGRAGLVIFCFALGNLFSPLGGVIADRFPRRPLLIWANLIAALVVLPILLVHGHHLAWLVYLVMFVYGVLGSAMGPAETALLPAIVPADLLAEANGVQQTLTQGLRMVTPLIGAGLFVLVGGGVVAVIDAGTFLIAAASLALLRVNEPGRQAAPAEPAVLPPAVGVLSAGEAAGAVAPDDLGTAGQEPDGAPPSAGRKPDGELSAGFRFLTGEPVLRSITITLALTLLTLGFTESAGFSVVTVGLHRSASFVGVLGTAQGVGAVAGGLVAARILRRTSESLLVVAALACLAVGVVLLIVPNLVVDIAALAVVGLVGPWMLVAATTALQVRTPADLLGRVSGALQLSLGLPQIASIGLGAALIAVVNYRILLVAVAAVAALAACYLLSVPDTRRRAPARLPAEAPDIATADSV